MVAIIELEKNSRSPRLKLGEIDTRSPIQSVKDAVNLFGEAAFSSPKAPTKKKYNSAERVFSKEAEVHLAWGELNKLKVQLEIAETTKSKAHAKLDRAKRTIDALSHKQKSIESNDFITTSTKEAKEQVKLIEQGNDCVSGSNCNSLKGDLEAAREKHSAAIDKLNSVKQLLRNVYQEYDASFSETLIAINQAAEAELADKVNNNRVNELSREIVTLKESISRMKCETVQTQGEEAKTIHRQNCIRQQLFNENLEESAKNLEALRKEFNPELSEDQEIQLASTASEIVILQVQIDYANNADLNSFKIVTSELEGVKELLQEVVQEECSMRILVKSLTLDMGTVMKKEQYQLKEMETKTKSAVGNMHIKLQKAKLELEETPTGEAKVRGASEEMISSFYKLVMDGENEKHEVEETIKQAEKIKKESESTRTALEEAENNMITAFEEAEEAKTAETSALEELKWLSERAAASFTSSSESGEPISISVEQFESLKRKIEKSDKLAEMKVAASMAEVEAVKASENKTIQKLQAMQNEINEIKAIAHEARKKTKMAKAAKKAVEGELRRWREREHKMQADAASRMLAESKIPMGFSPRHYLIHKLKQPSNKTSLLKKVLKPNLCCICNKKRSKVEGFLLDLRNDS